MTREAATRQGVARESVIDGVAETLPDQERRRRRLVLVVIVALLAIVVAA